MTKTIVIAPDFGEPWIGVDLDSTLAFYTDWQGGAIGRPIPLMVTRVKSWLKQGKRVKIFTARACTNDPDIIKQIQDWTELHIGKRLEVTSSKDWQMIEMWDDRCVQVMPNTGVTITDFMNDINAKKKATT